MYAESKLFAVHDRATLIAVLAQRFSPDNAEEEAIMARAGFGDPESYDFFVKMAGDVQEFSYDPFAFSDQLTLGSAARYIRSNWDELDSGMMLDAEVIRGEKDPDEAHRFEDEYDVF